MAKTFTVTFDHGGDILQVVDADGQTIPFSQFVPISDSPIPDVQGMTITEVYITASGCTIHQKCRKVKVC